MIEEQRQLEAYALDLKSVYAEERSKAKALKEALAQLHDSYVATAKGFAAAVEAKDSYTAGHLRRVTGIGMLLLEAIAPDSLLEPKYGFGFLLHDIGKLGVPDAILGKPDALTDDEWVVMKRHPEIGASIIAGIPFLEGAAEIVHAHHESWDGSGYPRQLSGLAIPLGARIFSVVDAFDAMTTDRVYRRALSYGEAIKRLRQGSGTQFWPDAVEAFWKLSEPAVALAAASGQI